jgi:hypothetical protein
MTEPSATVNPSAPPPTDSAQTAALIRQITAEARAAGETLVHDPDAPPDADDDAGDLPQPSRRPVKPATRPKPGEDPDADHDRQTEEAPAEDETGAEETPAEDETDTDATPVDLDPEAIKRALAGEAGVDMLALAEALGVDPEKLGVTPAQHRVLRLQQSRAKQMIKQAHDISKKLNEQYGDQVRARKAVSEGDLNPAIEFVESTFGMSWNDLNRMVGQLLQGKPVKDLEAKRELQQLRKKESERAESEKKAAEAKATEQKVTDAKAWIASSIKADKLATPELNRQLAEAGFPTITDLVFEEMQANYSKGLTDPRKALERVKLKLTKQAKVLNATGLVARPAPAKAKVMSARPRAGAQTGSAGNGRPMTDAELRAAVLKEAGLDR